MRRHLLNIVVGGLIFATITGLVLLLSIGVNWLLATDARIIMLMRVLSVLFYVLLSWVVGYAFLSRVGEKRKEAKQTATEALVIELARDLRSEWEGLK